MDKYKLRKCAKLSSCESCCEKNYCNYKEIIDQIIKENFIHIDISKWRKGSGKNKHRKND